MQSPIKINVPAAFREIVKPYRYKVYYGGRGSGKSHSIARYLIAKSLASPRKILCTRELQNSIQESVHSLLVGIINQYELHDDFIVTKAGIEGVNGSQFIFKGLAHNIDSVKSTEGVDDCWVEEADKVSQNSWDILIPTIRKPKSEITVSFNPTHDDDPVYQMFIVKGQPDSLIKKVNWYDNPHFPEVLRLEMMHMKETDYDKYCHVWEGDLRTISDAQIFKNKYCVMEFESEGVDVFYHGMDFGFANDPSAVIRCFIRNMNLYIDREGYGHGIELNNLSAIIRPVLEHRHWPLKCDCSRPETISFLRQPANGGWNAQPAKKYSGSVEDGIEFLKSFKQIIIHPRCVNTIEEFRRYSYKIDKRTNAILPIPIDAYNHIIDGVRYAMDDLIKQKVTIYSAGFL